MSAIGDYRRYQGYWHERNFSCRVREFLYRGHDCVSIENELLRVVVAADKGADILEFLFKPLDIDFLWHSYNGLRRFEHYRPSTPLPSGHFREHYPGGWHEMMPNGPEPCTHRGATFGQHGEATHLPWTYEIESDEPERVSVRFSVRTVRLPILAEKVLSLETGASTLRVHERIRSEASQEVEILWGHHPVFGWPFLESGCRVYLPPCQILIGESLPNSRLAPAQRSVWPFAVSASGEPMDLSIIPGPEVKSQDFIRLENFSEGWFSLVNPASQIGFAMRWDRQLFPVLGFWQIFRGALDFPWYGMNYLAALEPASELPSISYASGRNTALRLPAGGSIETELEATAFRSPLVVRIVKPGGMVE